VLKKQAKSDPMTLLSAIEESEPWRVGRWAAWPRALLSAIEESEPISTPKSVSPVSLLSAIEESERYTGGRCR